MYTIKCLSFDWTLITYCCEITKTLGTIFYVSSLDTLLDDNTEL